MKAHLSLTQFIGGYLAVVAFFYLLFRFLRFISQFRQRRRNNGAPTYYTLTGERGSRAEDKALGLLWSHLNDVQKKDFYRFGKFVVTSGEDTFIFYFNYTLTRHSAPMIDRNMCIQCYGLPRGDQLLALKLMAEADPGRFLRIAIY